MKIKSIRLQNFKKFSNLTIDGLMDTVKLVVLLGPNGSGKSSLIESMEVARQIYGFHQAPWKNNSNFDYYIKNNERIFGWIQAPNRPPFLATAQLSDLDCHGRDIEFIPHRSITDDHPKLLDKNYLKDQPSGLIVDRQQLALDLLKRHFINIEFHNEKECGTDQWKTCFNVRTPYRSVWNSQQTSTEDLKQRHWVQLIRGDAVFISNWRMMCSQWMEDSSDFDIRGNYDKWNALIDDTFVPVENFLSTVLDRKWKIRNLGSIGRNQNQERGFTLEKIEDTSALTVDRLSSGERAVVDIALNHFVVKKELGDEVIFVIDEPELHVASEVRGRLIEELFKLTPDKGQLWISTHSIEILEKSLELYTRNPSSVAFLDFTGKNFDYTEKPLKPIDPTYEMRSRVWEHAIGKNLKDRLLPNVIVFCEGEQETKPGNYADEDYYKKIFEGRWPIVDFRSVGGKDNVVNEIVSSTHMTKFIKDKNVQILGLRDRDDLSDAEIIRKDYLEKGIKVLPFRTIEHCFVQHDVLREFYENYQLDPNDLINEWTGIVAEKKEWDGTEKNKMRRAMQMLRDKVHELAPHVLKGETIGHFQLQLASYIKPGIRTYRKLEDAIFEDNDLAINAIAECIESEKTNSTYP